MYLKLIDTVDKKRIFPENQWNMDEKGYLLGLDLNFSIIYDHWYIFMLTGLASAQVYCVKHGTKEAKKMQGRLFLINIWYVAQILKMAIMGSSP